MSFATSGSQYQLDPFDSTLSLTRGAELANSFEFYRCVGLRIRALPQNVPAATVNTSAVVGALCYVPGIQSSPPASAGEIMENDKCLILSGGQTVPSPWFVLGRNELQTLVGVDGWLKCDSDTGESNPDQVVQGEVCVAGSVAQTYAMEIFLDWEFSVPANTSVNLREAHLAEAVLRRAKIVALVARRRTLTPADAVSELQQLRDELARLRLSPASLPRLKGGV
jgi:hypothetical protein